MKKFTVLLCTITFILLAGCGHEHTWNEAKCEVPKTCSECGKSEGEVLGHKYEEATCRRPKTCSVCGKTEGEALGHDYADVQCEELAKCTRCGEKNEDIEGHSWISATLDEAATCEYCGATEGEKVKLSIKYIGVAEEDIYSLVINEDCYLKYKYTDSDIDAKVYDYDGNLKATICVPWNNYSVCSISNGYIYFFEGDCDYFITYVFDEYGNRLIDGVKITKGEAKVPNFVDDWPKVFDDYIVNRNMTEVYARIDNGSQFTKCSKSEAADVLKIIHPSFDISAYDYVVPCKPYDYYYVKRTSDGKQGYIDKNGDIVCMDYMDAIAFNQKGYAMVSYDCKTYSIIDSNMNIIAKDVVEADNAYGDTGEIMAYNGNQSFAVFIE